MNVNQTLIRNIQQGNQNALKIFFEDFYPSACMVARKYLQNTDQAEDVAQEAFIEFWKRRGQFSSVLAIKGFIYTITRNKCLNLIKTSALHDRLLRQKLVSDDFYYELIYEEETYSIIYKAINKLPPQSRKIISLSLKGFKNPEIAEKLSISLNTVKTLKKNAYKELRSILKDYVFILGLISYWMQ